MNYKLHTLPSGLRVILAPMKDTQTATVLILAGTGSRFETKITNGLAHFLEHMFFKGTKKRPKAIDISYELDAVGGDYNAYTGKDRTGYWAKVDSKHINTALDVVSDIFLNAKIDQKEINRERGPILQEMNMYKDMPMRYIPDIFETLLYGDHPLGWEIMGTKKNIETVNRKDFTNYFSNNYASENCVVCVAGNFNQNDVLKKIKKDFEKIHQGDKPMFDRYDGSQHEPALKVLNKKTDQTQMMIGVRTYDFTHKDRYVLSVIATILGGGMSSRLFMAVRERRGLAYFVRTMTESYHDAGYMVTQAGVEHRNLEETIKIILQEYKKLASRTVDAKELRKAKDYIKGKMVMHLESSDEVATYLAEQEVVRGEIIPIEDKMKKIDRVTAADVRRVAKDIFVESQLNLAVIGPHEKEEKLRKLLTL